MIIVEGPDGSGKTTLIDKLQARTGLSVAPRVVTKGAEAMTDLVTWTEENVKKGFHPEIYDRHRLISEPIYGPVIRRQAERGFDDPEWFGRMLTRLYADCDPIIIYCLPPVRRVWENVQDDPDNTVVAQQHITQQIWGAYFNKALTESTFRLRTFLYDYTDLTTAPMLENFFVGMIDRLTKEN